MATILNAGGAANQVTQLYNAGRYDTKAKGALQTAKGTGSLVSMRCSHLVGNGVQRCLTETGKGCSAVSSSYVCGLELHHFDWSVENAARHGDACLMPSKSSSRRSKRRGVWKMEVADPLENFRDSFGNECLVERRARKELETNESYKKLTFAVTDMRSRMQEMVTQELYEEAAQIRDAMNMLEFRKRLLELSAKPRVLYRVGDVIVHRRYGYRGVIYGHDPECSAPRDWQDAMKIDLLPEGRNQPFYHVLVDTRDRPGGMSTYVAQENMVLHKLGRPVLHPWIPKFFVGFQDGTYVPGPKLRQVYPNDW